MKKLATKRLKLTLSRETIAQLELKEVQGMGPSQLAQEGSHCTICNYTVCVTC